MKLEVDISLPGMDSLKLAVAQLQRDLDRLNKDIVACYEAFYDIRVKASQPTDGPAD